jgi:hypothetical protein
MIGAAAQSVEPIPYPDYLTYDAFGTDRSAVRAA